MTNSRTVFIRPHQGVSAVNFGMTRGEVERAMGCAPERFKRSDFALEEDFFKEIGAIVHYDEHGRCNAIAFARDLGTVLEYDGYRLFDHPAQDVRSWARMRDPALDPADGFTSKFLGLSMWADWIDEADLPPEDLSAPAMSFLIFRDGYHEQERARLQVAGLVDG